MLYRPDCGAALSLSCGESTGFATEATLTHLKIRNKTTIMTIVPRPIYILVSLWLRTHQMRGIRVCLEGDGVCSLTNTGAYKVRIHGDAQARASQSCHRLGPGAAVFQLLRLLRSGQSAQLEVILVAEQERLGKIERLVAMAQQVQWLGVGHAVADCRQRHLRRLAVARALHHHVA